MRSNPAAIPVGTGNDPNRDFTGEYALSPIHAKLVPVGGSLKSDTALHSIYAYMSGHNKRK